MPLKSALVRSMRRHGVKTETVLRSRGCGARGRAKSFCGASVNNPARKSDRGPANLGNRQSTIAGEGSIAPQDCTEYESRSRSGAFGGGNV